MVGNWLNKVFAAGERIKAAIRKRATKEELEQSKFVSCCVGLVSKSDLSSNFHCCPHCQKHFKITPDQRFRYLFDNGIYELKCLISFHTRLAHASQQVRQYSYCSPLFSWGC